MSEIYDRIKQRRLELGLTVEELAQKMGYKDKSSISKIENGKFSVSLDNLEKLLDKIDSTLIVVDNDK